ncbi:spore germination protein [Bacillus pumilus]|uniref:Spore germination protein n=1 Tax=Bacillus pumilus TaxID=1408 RepID=A0A2A5ISI3_BACPU|nr:spore germination protein [Bacillus pumilus]PCK20183.1 spore germination protein [Bacillus pumilus]
MPAIVGPIHIDLLGGNGAATFGDVLAIAPLAVNHSSGGAGAFNSGDFMSFTNDPNATMLWDFSLFNQPQSFNA